MQALNRAVETMQPTPKRPTFKERFPHLQADEKSAGESGKGPDSE
jgi:hypothetical protein